MMTTPICDFVRGYAAEKTVRAHMPGHKGEKILGPEPLDITEICGADSLYEASGIIAESEKNASRLFGCDTFYSTEGSSLCIRAMLYLAVLHAKEQGKKPIVIAGRNAHKTFLSAAALLDIDIMWLVSEKSVSYLSCDVSAEYTDRLLSECREKPCAVYLTSPDYLGNMSDIKSIAEVCKKHGVLLIVDNAHGAYLHFCDTPQHPCDLGADMCCSSAHKTLPVLTGGAYLHISPSAPKVFSKRAKEALALFGSTSPSYLILASLDAANAYLEGYRARLAKFSLATKTAKSTLARHGFSLYGTEPLKITIDAAAFGYTGTEISDILFKKGIICEFSDPDFTVMMLSPENGTDELEKLVCALTDIPQKAARENAGTKSGVPSFALPEKVMSVREAVFAPRENIDANKSAGRILAVANVGCPPAVPIVVCGERINDDAVKLFTYYNIEKCTVIQE